MSISRKLQLTLALVGLLTATMALTLGLFTARADPSFALYMEVTDPAWPRPLSNLRTSLYLKMGADPEHHFKQFGGETPFEAAVSVRNSHAIDQLFPLLSRGFREATLVSACEAGNTELARALTQQEKGTDPMRACPEELRRPDE